MANGHGGARPNSGPKEKDPAAIQRALELIGSGVCSNAQEAAEHPEIRGRIGWRQIHEARKKAERAAASKPAAAIVALEVRPAEPPRLELDAPARPTVPQLPADREERARAVRKLFAERGAEHNTIQRLALTWGCSVAEVQQAIDDAAQVSAGLEVPKALRLVESRATWTEIRRKALDANDWKSAAMAQAALDRLDGLEGKPGAMPAGGYTRGQMVDAMRKVRTVLAPWPAAVAAFDALLGAKPATPIKAG